jgi:hypothetical protein
MPDRPAIMDRITHRKIEVDILNDLVRGSRHRSVKVQHRARRRVKADHHSAPVDDQESTLIGLGELIEDRSEVERAQLLVVRYGLQQIGGGRVLDSSRRTRRSMFFIATAS